MKNIGITLLLAFGLSFTINAQYPPAKLKALDKHPRSKTVTNHTSSKVIAKQRTFKIQDGGVLTPKSELKRHSVPVGNKRKARIFPKQAVRKDVHHLSVR